MFRIKICGVTRLDDVDAILDSPADAIGLNFYAASRRCIDTSEAERICRHVDGHLSRVGVFVNESAEQIAWLRDRLGLDYIQLHGDETAEFARQFEDSRLIQVLRVQADAARASGAFGQAGDVGVGDPSLDAETSWNSAGLLIDAMEHGHYGGTGSVTNWPRVAELRSILRSRLAGESCPKVILAGGLTPENVAEAISVAMPDAVDTAGGVEREPGKKAAVRVQRFAQEADEALRRLNR